MVFGIFCPDSGCLDSDQVNLTVFMVDSYGDGWEGTVLGLKQNGMVVGTFGENFTSGSTSGPITITVQGTK